MADVPHKTFPGWMKRTMTILLILVLLLVIAAVCAVLYVNSLFNKVNYVSSHPTLSFAEASSIAQEEWEPIPPEDTTPIEEATVPSLPEVPEPSDDHYVNILLIGQDRRPGQGTQRSDSMILVTCNRRTATITMTSIMRDQLVNIPGYGNDKLCHAYQYGGMPLLNQTLTNHFGIRVDGNIEVDFSGFESIINLLGGVDIALSPGEVEYLYQEYGQQFTVGMNHMNGKEALIYSRIRGLDNDYNRAGRQRKVLTCLIDRYKTQNLSTMLNLLEELLPLVTTDIPKDRLLSYVTELFPMMSRANIENLRIPADGTFRGGYIKVSSTHRMWCQYNIDFEANKKILREVFL